MLVAFDVQGWLGVVVGEILEVLGEGGVGEAGVDVVFLEGIGGKKREAGPDYGVRV